MIPKDFQEDTANRIFEIFKDEHQNRVLLADEVGLGKTIIACAVVEKVSEWHQQDHDDHFKVIYICSNINIANQNSKKLGIKEQDCLKISESRLSMQHLKIYQNQGTNHSYQQLIPLTPATSFSMTGGCGSQEERALMYAHLKRLDLLGNILDELSQFMRFYNLKYWDYYVHYYEDLAKKCDNNGSNYLKEMNESLITSIPPELIDEIILICKNGCGNNCPNAKRAINQLRRIFAQISLNKLEPDLVIMDEFQRFNDLIAPSDDEAGMLAKQFLHNIKTKVLLLSATPYKPYSTLEEISNNNSVEHYEEFMQVMNFLFYDQAKNTKFKDVWKSYSNTLSELSSDNLTVLISHKTDAEGAMYKSVCRTERFNTGIIDDSGVREIEISQGDIISYIEAQSILNNIGLGNIPIDYVKSSPYLFTFMESYKLKEKIEKHFSITKSYDLLKKQKTLLVKKSLINTYKKIESNNARLACLNNVVFDDEKNGIEKLLWLPPSCAYYKTEGVYSKENNYSKTLVFSSWEMVPRMIASMLSYESERMIYSKLNENNILKQKKYFAEDNKKRTHIERLKDDMENIIIYPSVSLAKLYNPLTFRGKPIEEIKVCIQKQVVQILNGIKKKYKIPEGRGSAKEFYTLLKLIDGDTQNIPNQY